MDLNKLWIFINVIVQVVSPMDNIWIGPWAIYPHYMDPTLFAILFSSDQWQSHKDGWF